MTSWWGRTRQRPNATSRHLRGLREGYGEGEEEAKVGEAPPALFGGGVEPNSDTLPVLFGKFTRYLNSKAMTCPGIFAKDIPDKDVEVLKRRVAVEGEKVQLTNHTKNQYVVARLFVEYLEGLAEPLLTYSMYNCFMTIPTLRCYKHQLAMLVMYLQMLPRGYVVCVQFVLSLLQRFRQQSDQNGTSTSLLTRVFRRCFLRPPPHGYFAEGDEEGRLLVTEMLVEESETILKSISQVRRRVEKEIAGRAGKQDRTGRSARPVAGPPRGGGR